MYIYEYKIYSLCTFSKKKCKNKSIINIKI